MCPRPVPAVLAAAREAGVTRLFRVGGAHAVAALAYGTRTVPRVDKIVGPGNAYVAAAKALVAADCGIDFFAGPSEIVVVSRTGDPDWIAADLVAQAEHDPDARAILITPSRRLASAVAARVEARAPRTGPARTALRTNGGIIVTRTLNERAGARGAARSRAPRLRRRRGRRAGADGRHGVRGRLQRAGGGRLRSPGRTTCCRPTARRGSGAA